ncbi:hypothetical protein M3P36_04920 [Altererythrobacter sp. KTW20L]|uniref:hypothetical protein n=1 Tax=Altererythrobacter sp. KTW20L TaxID=2942210 RepID=UPI0020BFFB91|nr:hypothetical protein [Altererythrobacter sp. KTW20L]MCL6250391.1 hypothetical protein [Altererythrobacter sp. KTW20L]
MTNIVDLVTSPQRSARQNRDELIREAREDCAAFGDQLDFDAIGWNVSRHCPRPGGKAGRKVMLYFATHENGTKKGSAERTPLADPFGSVIKAIIRLKKDGNPKIGEGPLGILVRASRYLATTLEDRGYDPCLLVPADFDAACETIKARTASKDSRYRLGVALQEISTTLSRHRVTQFAFEWQNAFDRPETTSRVGKAAEANRKKKLPDEEILDELARLSHLITDTSDLILMAAVKLFHCAPWRIGEVNTLPADCWVERQKIDDHGPVVDEDGVPVMRYGIRYWPEKAEQADIKWIPTAMVPVARSALDTLMAHTQGARDLAKWYESHPSRAWLPGADLGPSQLYTIEQVREMFGLSKRSAAYLWLKNRSVPIDRSTTPHTVTRRELEVVLLDGWHKLDYLDGDRRGLRRSNHLFLTFANQHSYRGTNRCMLGFTTDQNISDFLSGRGDAKDGKVLSIFERFGSTGSDGQPMRVNSHAFRHWLNTLAQRSGVNDLLVARWSGRSEVSQNSVYDHVSGVELAENARDLMATGQVMGALADVHDRLPPTEREGFRDTVFATAFVTEIGMCDADFMSAPCPEIGACATCEHCNIKKGDEAGRERSQKDLEDSRWLHDRAIEEEGEGAIGASNYIEAHRQRIESLERIVAIHDDPKIPDGTWVRPNAASRDHYCGPKLRGHNEEGKGA